MPEPTEAQIEEFARRMGWGVTARSPWRKSIVTELLSKGVPMPPEPPRWKHDDGDGSVIYFDRWMIEISHPGRSVADDRAAGRRLAEHLNQTKFVP